MLILSAEINCQSRINIILSQNKEEKEPLTLQERQIKNEHVHIALHCEIRKERLARVINFHFVCYFVIVKLNYL